MKKVWKIVFHLLITLGAIYFAFHIGKQEQIQVFSKTNLHQNITTDLSALISRQVCFL